MPTPSAPSPRLVMLGRDQCETIHLASLEILRRAGVLVLHPEALRLLRDTSAVITAEHRVHMPADLVEWALAQAPRRISLCQRGTSEAAIRLEGWNVSFGTGSDCRNYLDPQTGQVRLFTAQDVVSCIRLVDVLPQIDFCMSMGIPADVSAISPWRYQYSLMLEHTAKPVVFVSENAADCEAIVAMAASAAGGIEKLRLSPTLVGYGQVDTPLKHTAESLGKLLYLAEQRIPIVHQPSPMMGGNAPVTMAGALALGNAEVLSGLVIQQLKSRGAPFVYGTGQHHLDMKTMISVYGAPEFQVARAAIADMARYYDLPHWGYAGHTDSCAMDEQAASDATSSVMVALLSGVHMAHDVGYMEAGLTTSPELIVYTADQIDMLRHFMRGVPVDAESLALDVIFSVAEGGGDLLGAPHTVKHFRECWQPKLFSRQRRHDWEAAGAKRLANRLQEKTLALMASPAPASLPDAVRSEVQYILAQSDATRAATAQ